MKFYTDNIPASVTNYMSAVTNLSLKKYKQMSKWHNKDAKLQHFRIFPRNVSDLATFCHLLSHFPEFNKT